MRNALKFLKQVESKTNQFEIGFKSLARLSTQFRVKKVYNIYLICKLRKFGDKSRKSLATKKIKFKRSVQESYGPLN